MRRENFGDLEGFLGVAHERRFARAAAKRWCLVLDVARRSNAARLPRSNAFPSDQAKSKRSAFITLVHAATKSFTNFSFESAHA